MRLLLRCIPLVVLLLMAGCRTTQQSMQQARTDENGVMDITVATMTKDAVRLKGVIQTVNGAQDQRNSYDFVVQEIVKYGATFSSAEPKTGETVTLLTPSDVTFEKGQVIIIDVLTPRIDQGTKPMRVRLAQP